MLRRHGRRQGAVSGEAAVARAGGRLAAVEGTRAASGPMAERQAVHLS